jgi:drug/metabolite transporter (DMT)-like permease
VGWIGWSLVALVCWGVWAVLNKLAMRSLGWPHLVIASWLVSTVAVLMLLLTGADPRALASRDGALALAAGTASLVAVVAFYIALRLGPVATVTPLSALYPAVAVVLAVVVLRESPSAVQWAGVGMAILAGVLLTRP